MTRGGLYDIQTGRSTLQLLQLDATSITQSEEKRDVGYRGLLYTDARTSTGYRTYIAFWYSREYRTHLTGSNGII